MADRDVDLADPTFDSVTSLGAVSGTDISGTGLDIVSTTKGSKPAPSMTEAQRDLIGVPTAPMMIFNTDANEYQWYNATSTSWDSIGGGGLDGDDKRLGVSRISTADTDTDIYSPATGYAYGIKVVIFNDNVSGVAKVRLINRDGAKANNDHILYDISIQAQAEPITVLIPGMSSSETLTAMSDTTLVNFAAFGQESAKDVEAYCVGRHDISVVDTDEDLVSFTDENQIDLMVCNRNNSETATVLIKVTDGATAADEDKVYAHQILPNQSKMIALDFNVAATYKVVVQSSVTGVNFQAYARAKTEFSSAMILPQDVQLKRANESGLFTMSADDSTLTAGTIVAFDSTNRNTGIEFDSGNNRWKLKANKTYRLGAFLAPEYSSSSGVYRARFYDITNTAYMGLSSFCVPPTYSSNVSQQPSSKAEITPSTDIYVGLYTEGVSLTSKIEADYSYVEIQEISSLVDYVKNPYQTDYYQTDLTVTGTNWTTTSAVGCYYKTADGTHRLKFNIEGTLSVTAWSITLTIAGVVFKAGTYQGFAGQAASNTTFTSGVEALNGRAVPTTDTVVLNAGASSTQFTASFDVELDAAPTWI
jgi:hypothetical protein